MNKDYSKEQTKIEKVKRVLRKIINPENYYLNKFMKYASKQVKSGSRVLDAGAGVCPYKRFFNNVVYESTDYIESKTNRPHDFLCDLSNIPKKDNTYDAIINTQVLEHVENPQQVINEFYRILKQNGKLFVTVPQGGRVHGEPYHFLILQNMV